MDKDNNKPKKPISTIHIVCGFPFKDFKEEKVIFIKKIIEDELHHWPDRDEIAEIAKRVKTLRESKVKMIVNLLRQQEGMYRFRQEFFKDDDSESVQQSAGNDQNIDFFEDD